MRGDDAAPLERSAKRFVERPLHSPLVDRSRLSRGEHLFSLFQQFPELHVGIFGKSLEKKSDAGCAKVLGFSQVACLKQVHGNTTHIVEGPMDGNLEGDGLITSTPSLALSVRWADCQAFVTYVPEKSVIGVLHAGWRGMAQRAITAHFRQLQANFGVEPSEVFVGAAPSLCKNCADFSDPLRELPSHLHPFIEGKNVDLQAAADAELDALGVPRAQRERHPVCTRCGEGFWSWRRDRVPEARNYLVTGIRSLV